MQPVTITDMKVTTENDTKVFSLKANGIPLEVSCTLKEFKENLQETLDKVNENFRNSLRYIKYYKNLPKNPDAKQLNVWVASDTGLAVRLKNAPVKEFIPFNFS